MKNQNYFPIILILTIIVIILLQSCATTDMVTNSRIIQKRKYTKGFYVNTIRNKINKDLILGKSTFKDTSIIKGQNNILDNNFEKYEKNTGANCNYLIASTVKTPISLPKEKLLSVNISSKQQKPNKNIVKRIINKGKREVAIKSLYLDKLDENPKKILPAALIGFSLSFIGLLCMLILKNLFWWSIFLGLIIEVVALIMSIIGLIRINKDSTVFKGKSEAIFGIFFSSVLLLSNLFIIIMILFFPISIGFNLGFII